MTAKHIDQLARQWPYIRLTLDETLELLVLAKCGIDAKDRPHVIDRCPGCEAAFTSERVRDEHVCASSMFIRGRWERVP